MAALQIVSALVIAGWAMIWLVVGAALLDGRS
jgi:hypothetical protein